MRRTFRTRMTALLVALLLVTAPLEAVHNSKATNLVANTAIDAISVLANSGYLDIYSASQPANADTAVTSQVCLASLRFSSTAFGAGLAGVATANAITADSDADATGTAVWFRVYKSDHTGCNDATGTRLWDGNVGTTGTDLVLPTTSIVQHGIITVTSYIITQSKG